LGDGFGGSSGEEAQWGFNNVHHVFFVLYPCPFHHLFSFQKKTFLPCEPFLPLSSSNIVSYLELPSNALQLVLMENHKTNYVRLFFTNLKKSHVSKIAISNS
jgi:hypothetical protein